MHAALTTRLARLNTKPATPKQLKAGILDLAKDCQVLPEQGYLLRETADSMALLVRRVFGPLAMIFPLTEAGRRHVFLAVLAKLEADNRLEVMEDAPRIALLEKLLTLRNEDLIADAFGSTPQGYTRLLTRLGDVARSRQFYLDLHALLSEAPELAKPLLAEAGGDPLSDVLLEMMITLPRVPAAVALARHFQDVERLKTFLLTYQTLTGSEDFDAEHLSRITAGETPERIIEELYLSYRFPEAFIPAHPQITHIKDGFELIAVAEHYGISLDGGVPSAVRGEKQYYVWRRSGAAELVFALQNDNPFGWYLIDAKHEGDEEPSAQTVEELRLFLRAFGITRPKAMERMARTFSKKIGGVFSLNEIFEDL